MYLPFTFEGHLDKYLEKKISQFVNREEKLERKNWKTINIFWAI